MARTWFITGVSSGLGRALAWAALAQGDVVCGTVRTADALADFVALGERAHGFRLDVTDVGGLSAAIAEAEQLPGGLDVLVNNAGYGLVGAVEETSLEEARTQLEVNLLAPLAAIRAALPGMRARRRGHIVNVTSVSGLAAWSGTGVYCASKFALEGLGEALAQEVGPLGVKVTNVAPGGIRTDYAGRSLVRAAERIEDYADTAHAAPRLLSEGAGREANDPARVAAAILQVVDAEAPPLHLLLGSDALHYALRKMGALTQDIGEWAAVSAGVAFPD
jgi:NAD(P)-dependent dehydrogenase (short-subunit alcohol dehydrogenase family)